MSTELSQVTKKKKNKKWIFFGISTILTILPIIIALGLGFFRATDTGKVGLSMVGLSSIILAGIGFVTKNKLQDVIMGIVIIALYYTCKSAIPIVIVYVACRFIDTLIITPLYNKYKTEYTINKEFDKRM